MANPAIIYNPGSGSRTILLPTAIEDLRGPGRVPERLSKRTRSGVEMSHFYDFHEEHEIVLSRMSTDDTTVQTFIDSLVAFWAWAGKGGTFAFALDSAAVGTVDRFVFNTPAPSGQKIIELTSLSNIVVDSKYHIEGGPWPSGGAAAREVVKVQLVGTPAGCVTVYDNLIYSYIVGDIFRSRYYWPLCIAVDQVNPIHEREGKRADFMLKFRTYTTLV